MTTVLVANEAVQFARRTRFIGAGTHNLAFVINRPRRGVGEWHAGAAESRGPELATGGVSNQRLGKVATSYVRNDAAVIVDVGRKCRSREFTRNWNINCSKFISNRLTGRRSAHH